MKNRSVSSVKILLSGISRMSIAVGFAMGSRVGVLLSVGAAGSGAAVVDLTCLRA